MVGFAPGECYMVGGREANGKAGRALTPFELRYRAAPAPLTAAPERGGADDADTPGDES